MTKICPQCKSKNDDDYEFCKKCGHELESMKVCPVCKTENESEYAFCKKCGHDLNEPAAKTISNIPNQNKPPQKVDKPPKSEGGSKNIIIIGVVAILVIVIGVFIFYNSMIPSNSYSANGISFNYPTTYKISSVSNLTLSNGIYILLFSDEGYQGNVIYTGDIIIEVFNSADEMENEKNRLMKSPNSNLKTINIQGTPAYEIDVNKSTTFIHYVIFKKGTKTVVMRYELFRNENKDKTQEAFDIIKNSLKV